MQLLLPIFPAETELLTATWGVFSQDGIVYYLHCGEPMHSHLEEDLKNFRYITSKLILQGCCKKIDISRFFGVSYDSVNRYVKRLREVGESGFFEGDNRRGHCYKLVPEVLERMQGYLDEGKSNSEIARIEGVTEGSIRYAIKNEKLKKKPQNQLNPNRLVRTGTSEV